MPAYKHIETREGDRKVVTWRYRVVVTLPDGSKTRITGTPEINTRAAAEAAERLHIQRAQSPFQRVEDAGTFTKFVDERWWPTVVNRPSVVEEKEVHLRLHLKPALGHLKLARIDVEALAKLVKALKDAELSLKSIKNVLATLHRILSAAVKWNCLAKLPEFPKIKPPEPEWDHLTVAEVDALLSAARDDRDRLLLMFAAKTGARAGEQLAAEWGDVDWTRGTIRFQRSHTRGETGGTKSGRHRTVPLSPALLSALRASGAPRGQRLIFVDDDGKQLRIGQLHECLWRTLTAAGLRDIRWHDLRHTFASNLVAAGVPVPTVQRWMGHSSIVMTMRYAHLAPDAGLSMIGALDSSPNGEGVARTGATKEEPESNQPVN